MASHHSRHSHTSHRSSRGESQGRGSYEHHLLEAEKLKGEALEVRIKTLKKALTAAKGFAKDLHALGLSKEDAGHKALEMLENEAGHGGH